MSEVATGYYSNPQPRHLIQVHANPANLGRVLKPDVCVPADAGLSFDAVLGNPEAMRRPPNPRPIAHIQRLQCDDVRRHAVTHAERGADPMALTLALRRNL